MSSIFSQFRDNLNLPKTYKRRDESIEDTDESILEDALKNLPIPLSFSSQFNEVKGLSASILNTLVKDFGKYGQYMILIGRALKWSLFLKYGPLDWKTIKPFYVDYFVMTCHIPLSTVQLVMMFELGKKSKVEDHLKRLWNDFRNSALIFWDRSLRYPSHELTYGALQHLYIRHIPAGSFIPWPSPQIKDTVIFSMKRRYIFPCLFALLIHYFFKMPRLERLWSHCCFDV